MSPRFIYRLIIAFLKRFKAIIVVGIIIGAIFFLILTIILPSLDSTHEIIGVVGRYTTDNMPTDITSKLSSGLTVVDLNGNVNPGLAKSWESNDGGKTWTFLLDENIEWQDGEKLLSSDIDYKFSDASVEIVDDLTVKFNLNSHFSAFPVIVNKPIFKKGLVGTGDWEVKKISLAGGYIQKLDIMDKQKNKITYRFYPTEDRLRLAFKLGAVDIIEKIQNPEPFDSWKVVKIEKTVGYDNFVGIFFNTESELLAEKTVRQALAYAIDKEIYLDENSIEGQRALSPISPFSWAYNSQVKQYSRDIEKTNDIKGSKIKLSTLPNLLKTAEKIKKDWSDAGIECEIEVVTDVPDVFEAFLATVDIPKDPDQYSLWHSTQIATNISKFKNPRIDKLLEDGRTELDQESRKKIYLDFQRFIVEEVPAIFLYHPIYYSITRK